ncbi:transposase zinc-binding domain-containing protein, partial [Myxococcota bacterium]
MSRALESAAVVDTGATPSTAKAGYVYQQRRPESGTLHQVVRDNLQTLYAAVEEGSASPLPEFVRREFEQFLDCGLLCRGFALFECEDCSERRLVAFSCKGRAWCPACCGRRMAQTAANLVDQVLPPSVPLRQFVVTFPFELRPRLAYNGQLLTAVGRVVDDSVLGFYRRHLRDHHGIVGKSGAVTVVQRASSDLRLNPHLHVVALDGVFAPDAQGSLVFHSLPCLETTDVADLLQVIRVRVLRWLERQGVVECTEHPELTLLDDDFAEREPALAALAMAAVSGRLPAGPEIRQRPPLTLHRSPGVEVNAPLSVAELGFSLHAATYAAADDPSGRDPCGGRWLTRASSQAPR